MITFRNAAKDDAKLLFKWRNEPATVENSFSEKPVGWENHQEWFEKKLNDPACHIFILEADKGIPVGQVRFDIDKNKTAEISISIDKDHRKKGYAVEGLKITSQWILNNVKPKNILAYIKKDNISSRKTFSKAGFKKTKVLVLKSVDCYRFELDV